MYRGKVVTFHARRYLRFPMPDDAMQAAKDGLAEAVERVKSKCSAIDEKHPLRKKKSGSEQSVPA